MVLDHPNSVLRRRFLKTIVGVSTAGYIAGCSGNDGSDGGDSTSGPGGSDGTQTPNPGSTEELDRLAEEALERKERAEQSLEGVLDLMQEGEWERCLTDMDEMQGQIQQAREPAEEALGLAETGGHTKRAEALVILLEIFDLQEELATEIESVCVTGADEGLEAAMDESEPIFALLDQIEAKEEEFEQATSSNS